MSTPAPNIFDQLAQHDTALAQHDQTVAQSKNIFDQIAANGGKAPEVTPPEQKTEEQEPGFWQGSPSVPGQAIQEASTMSPEKMKEGAVTAGKTALAGATAGTAALGVGGIMALAAPGLITEEVATGLLDEFGEPITRQIVKEGPSLVGKSFQAATQWATEHPTTAKIIIRAAGVASGLKALADLSKLSREFGGK